MIIVSLSCWLRVWWLSWCLCIPRLRWGKRKVGGRERERGREGGREREREGERERSGKGSVGKGAREKESVSMCKYDASASLHSSMWLINHHLIMELVDGHTAPKFIYEPRTTWYHWTTHPWILLWWQQEITKTDGSFFSAEVTCHSDNIINYDLLLGSMHGARYVVVTDYQPKVKVKCQSVSHASR